MTPNSPYDKAGNRTSVLDSDIGTQTVYSPNNLNEYSQAGSYTVINGTEHQISDYQGLHYSYINDERLISVSAGHGSSYQLAYDALGRCVKRTLAGVGPGLTTYYIYDGDKPVAEYDSASLALVAYNVYGKGVDEILERLYLTNNTWNTYFYQQNQNGSVTHLTAIGGALLELYRYDAFGAPSIWGPPNGFPPLSTSAYGNRFMFTGREFSPFGFYEYRARAYHPSLGRFTSEDPKVFDAGDYNLFRYCHNDPIDFSDAMGTEQDFATVAPREVSRMRADDDSHRYIADTDGKWHTRDDSGPQMGTVHNEIGEMGRQVIGQGANPPMPRIVMRAPPAVLTAGHARGQGLADITNVHRLAQFIRPDPAAAAGMRQFANVIDYGVAYPGAGAIAAPVAVPLALNGLYHGSWYAAGAAAAIYQAAIRYPGAVSNVQRTINAFITPGGAPSTEFNSPENYGTAANLAAGQIDPKDFGP